MLESLGCRCLRCLKCVEDACGLCVPGSEESPPSLHLWLATAAPNLSHLRLKLNWSGTSRDSELLKGAFEKFDGLAIAGQH